jgi:hypothetical protein
MSLANSTSGGKPETDLENHRLGCKQFFKGGFIGPYGSGQWATIEFIRNRDASFDLGLPRMVGIDSLTFA